MHSRCSWLSRPISGTIVLVVAVFLAVLPVAKCTAILGVPPADLHRYSGEKFRCIKGGTLLPIHVVNDDYCDCPDGSDEPGTGACAGQEDTLFYCVNEGSAPRHIYASRVGDGVCDCCDGSDEAFQSARRGDKSPCPQDCAAEGRRLAAEKTKRLEVVRNGVAKKQEAAQKATADNNARKEELAKLEAELPEMERELAAARAEVKAEAEKQASATCESVPTGCRWRQTGGCSPDGAREPGKDQVCSKAVPKGSSGFCDCDGDGIKGPQEPGYNCSTGPGTCCEVCAAAVGETADKAPEAAAAKDAAAGASATEGGAASEAKPQVSEYAKWMDGASDAAEEHKAGHDGKKKVSEYAKWMEKADESLDEDDEEGEDMEDGDESYTGSAGSRPSKVTKGGSIGSSTAKNREKDMEEKVRKQKDKIRELKQKLEALTADHIGYAALEGQTISKRLGEWEYKLNFFKEAHQGHTSLGKWSGWSGKYEGAFKGGTKCWEGPNRELTVKFSCGAEAELQDVAEPSKCVYEAYVLHPGACEESEMEMLSGGSFEASSPKAEL